MKKYQVQILGISIKKGGDAKVTFACDKATWIEMDELRDMEQPVYFWIEGLESEKIIGEIVNVNSKNSKDIPRTFKIETIEPEKIKVGMLSGFAGLKDPIELCVEIV